MNKRVTLNVGGIRHEVMWRMLEQIPESRLGLLSQVFYFTYALSKFTSFRQKVMMTFLNIAQIILWLKTNSISIGILYQYVSFNKIKRICKFASRFCKFSCALQGVLRIKKICKNIRGKIVAKNTRKISLHDLPKK